MPAAYLLRRIGVFVLVAWLAATLNFFLPRLTGQDPVRVKLLQQAQLGGHVQAGIEEMVRRRVGDRGLGFGAHIGTAEDDKDALRRNARTEDLIKFGMIPEFMGRLPVIVSCDALDVDALAEVLWKPKNALVKQYQRFFSYDSVELVFTEDALWEISDKALDRETGARGLRSIIEQALLDVMFELPSRKDVSKCVITKETIKRDLRPTLVTTGGRSIQLDEPAEESA